MAPGNFRFGSCCKLCIGFMIVIFLLFMLTLFFWCIVDPITIMKVHVVDAQLNQFDLADDNKLNYSLTLNITMSNVNKMTGIYYDRFEATADFYHGKIKLGLVAVKPFYQDRKNTYLLPQLVFKGLASIQQPSSSKFKEHFNKDKGDGMFDINVRLYLKIRLKLIGGSAAESRDEREFSPPTVKCNLRIPLRTLSSNQTVGFKAMRCQIKEEVCTVKPFFH